MQRMTIGSLFTGLGGLDQAAESVFGATTSWQVEIDSYCTSVLERRFPNATRYQDVREFDPTQAPRTTIICSGSPCQDLSIAGGLAGLHGKKSSLFFEKMRIVEAHRPEWVFFENVPGLLTHRTEIDQLFESLGYGIAWQKLNAFDAGYPHRRARIFALAKRDASGSALLTKPTNQLDLFRRSAWRASEKVWPTPTATFFDQRPQVYYARHDRQKEKGYHCGKPLNVALFEVAQADPQLKVNADWVDCLMGYPPGWSDPNSELGEHCVPSSPGCAQKTGEPPYMSNAPDGWSKRMKALGNSVVAPQAELALRRLKFHFEQGENE